VTAGEIRMKAWFVENLPREIEVKMLRDMKFRIEELEQIIHILGKPYKKDKTRTNDPARKPLVASKTLGWYQRCYSCRNEGSWRTNAPSRKRTERSPE
jgi:hypothetical protein